MKKHRFIRQIGKTCLRKMAWYPGPHRSGNGPAGGEELFVPTGLTPKSWGIERLGEH